MYRGTFLAYQRVHSCVLVDEVLMPGEAYPDMLAHQKPFNLLKV
jgi:hypothetical protein